MNYVDLREATHDMAIAALRQTPAVVRLVVLRDESQFKDEGMLAFEDNRLTNQLGWYPAPRAMSPVFLINDFFPY